MELDLNHGLGNQLSLYFAGLAYCLKFNRKLLITISENQNGNHDSYRDIKELSLPGRFINRSNNRFNLFPRLEQFFAHRIPTSFRITGRYYSSRPGYDEDLLSTNGIHKLHGFFHSFAYFDLCKRHISDLSVDKIFPLSSHASEIARLIQERNSIAIHIRRGDYLIHSDSFGVLGVNYYKNAIASLGLNNPESDYYIFSDDYHAALEIAEKLGISGANFPDRDGLLKASEVIHLLALSSNLIIANSSLSYWAAVVSGLETKVIAPKPFYRNQEISESFFYRTNWKLIDANFN